MKITDLQINCAHDKIVPLEELVPNPRNPNLHSPQQVEWIARVINHRGWRAPIIVSNRSGFIVCGHGRLQAAKSMKLEGVPVDFQDFESEADEWAHMVADNALAEMSAMAEDDLLGLARDITDGGIDMDLAGLDAEQLVKPVESYLVERDEMTAKAFRAIWDLKSEKSPTLKCPQDYSDLHVFSYKGVELDFCMDCKGLWFDVFELEAFSNRDDLEKANSRQKANFRQANGEREWQDLTVFGVLDAAASLVVGCVGIGLSGGGGPGN